VTKRRIHRLPRRPWTKPEDRIMRKRYPHMPTADLTDFLPGRGLWAIYQRAQTLGLRKTAAYLNSPDAHRLDGVKGMGTRFQPGHTTWNKGTHYKAGGRSKLTRFKPGHIPRNWKAVGSTRINSEGYRDIKITDLGRGALDWRGIHRLNWIAVHGPIPKTHFLRFRDGDRLNALVENLELVTRAEHLRRNYHDRYPLEIKRIVQLRGALQRQINKREGRHERKHNQRSS
jgi:hypothetical protein